MKKIVELTIPKMGESINEVKILNWLKKEGDFIKEEESILEVSTDKVDTEIPSLFEGKIKKIISKKGDIVQIGNPIARIETKDSGGFNDEDPIKLADELFKDAIDEFSSENKKIIDQKNDHETNHFFSPLVLNIAKEENISIQELEKINGSGKENRITKLDLMKYLDLKNSKTKNKKLKSKDNERIIEPDRVRKLIAEKMVDSKKISPHETSFVD